MSDRFIQKRIELNRATSTGRIKVAKLIELIEQHPYSAAINETFNVKSILNEYMANISVAPNHSQILAKVEIFHVGDIR